MTHLSELTGAGGSVRIGGRDYRTKPLDHVEYGLLEDHIRAERPDPIPIAVRLAAGADPDVQREILGRAYEDALAREIVTGKDIDDWKVTPQGFAYCFWRNLVPAYPTMTLDEACKLLDVLGEEDDATSKLADIRDKGSGMPAKNSPSPTKPEESPSPSLGS